MNRARSFLISSTLLTLAPFLFAACGGADEENEAEGDASGGAPASSGGGNGSGGELVSGVGGAPQDNYMSDDFSLEESGGVYSLTHGEVAMAVTTEQGGRILSFTVAGGETLVQEGEAAQHGSTFWPSPQVWSWPPSTSIAEIDPNPYSAAVQPQRLVLTSENNPFMGAIVTKTFGPAESAAGVLGFAVVYTIENTNQSALSYAGWEISRAASGVVFYPEGPGGVLEKSSLSPDSAILHGWYTYDATSLSGVPKIFADGSDGWLAWGTAGAAGDGTLVIKAFQDIPASAFATNEAEVEIYADPSGQYMEVEQQGPATLLQPGEILTWRVEWYGATIPEAVSVESGSQALVDLVTTTLGPR